MKLVRGLSAEIEVTVKEDQIESHAQSYHLMGQAEGAACRDGLKSMYADMKCMSQEGHYGGYIETLKDEVEESGLKNWDTPGNSSKGSHRLWQVGRMKSTNGFIPYCNTTIKHPLLEWSGYGGHFQKEVGDGGQTGAIHVTMNDEQAPDVLYPRSPERVRDISRFAGVGTESEIYGEWA